MIRTIKWIKFITIKSRNFWGTLVLSLMIMIGNGGGQAGEKGATLPSANDSERKPAQAPTQIAPLSDYVLSLEDFKGLNDRDQIQYLAFLIPFAYNIEIIQNAPQDQFVPRDIDSSPSTPDNNKSGMKRKNARIQDDGTSTSNGSVEQSDRSLELWSKWWWGELASGSSRTGDSTTSSCLPDGKRQGTPCLYAGYQSTYMVETKHGMTRDVCQIPQEIASACGYGKMSCNTFGMVELFQVLDKYSSKGGSPPVCVPENPRSRVAENCGSAFAQWRKINLSKLFIDQYRVPASQKSDFYDRYLTLLAYTEKALGCIQDKVDRCRSLAEMSRGTFGNGGSWSYDPRTNTSTVSFPGTRGYASFQGKPKGGTFSGIKADPEFQRSECQQIQAAHRDIGSQWERVPENVKAWVWSRAQGNSIPVRQGPDRRRRSPGAV